MSDEVTIVTAFVDIGRGDWEGIANGAPIAPYIKRDTETYLKRFQRLTKLKNPIVCFTQSKFFERILAMREDIILINIDSIFDDHQHLINSIKAAQKNPDFTKHLSKPSSPEYWSPEYVAINFMKSHFVTYAVESGLCQTSTSAWIDFGYCRDEVYCPENKTFTFNTENKINFFGMAADYFIRPIFDIVMYGHVYIQGCHIVAPNKDWKALKQLVNDSLSVLFKVGMVDDDQTLLLMAYRAAPEMFKINPGSTTNWFNIFEGNCND